MRPSAILCSRLKTRLPITTKNVRKGFYRGTGTGALGAHTQYGNYMIDWRKVRHFVVPNLQDVKLTPYVSGAIYKDHEIQVDRDGNTYNTKRIDGKQYLKWWKRQNSLEYDHFLRYDDGPEAEQSEQGEIAVEQDSGQDVASKKK